MSTTLRLIDLPDTAIRAALRTDGYPFEDFHRFSGDFEETIKNITRILNVVLLDFPANAPTGIQREGIEVVFITDGRSILEGYQWTYGIVGERNLLLATTPSDYLKMAPDADGIDACLGVANHILGKVNNSIRDAVAYFSDGADG